jgi:hypothetical protein
MAWTEEKIREVTWGYMNHRQHFTENYKKVREICRQQNLECKMYMDAKKLMNQKNYIMKNKKITEMEVEEIKKAMQKSQRRHLNGKEQQLEQLCTIRDGKQKQNSALITDKKMENHQHMNHINK